MKRELFPKVSRINWIAMSRLYDPNDEEFIDMFKDKMNLTIQQKKFEIKKNV